LDSLVFASCAAFSKAPCPPWNVRCNVEMDLGYRKARVQLFQCNESGRFQLLRFYARVAELRRESHREAAACAAAINSSGFVPGALSNRVLNEYGVFESTPLSVNIVPFPSLQRTVPDC